MQQFSSRERLGVVAAGTIVLFLGVGGWAFSHASVPAGTRPSIAAATLRPTAAGGVPAALEIAAGGAASAATLVPSAATTVAVPSAPAPSGGSAIFVHVAGAVKTPGVYKFQPGDRINDAVKAAGGFRSGADRDALNLADTLQDADQIFIPTADTVTANAGNTGSKAAGASSDVAVIADGPARMPAGSSVRKSKGRRSAHPLITPGVAPARNQTVEVGPLPAPTQPGDVVIQPLPAPGEDQKIAAIEAKVPRRGRVIGRPATVALPAATTDAAPDAGDDATPAATAAVAPRAAYGSVRKSNIVGGVSKKGSAAKGGAGKSAKLKNPGDGVVHLNSASAEQLEKLPGVGPAMSGRIVEYRTEIGKFTDPSQLMDVKGIGDKKYAKMQPFLAL